METIKQPAMLLAMVNTAAIGGMFFYNNKQFEKINARLDDLFVIVKKLDVRVGEIAKIQDQKGEAVKTIDDEIKSLRRNINALPSTDEITALNQDVDSIIASVETLTGKPLDLPGKQPAPYRVGRQLPSRNTYRTQKTDSTEEDDIISAAKNSRRG